MGVIHCRKNLIILEEFNMYIFRMHIQRLSFYICAHILISHNLYGMHYKLRLWSWYWIPVISTYNWYQLADYTIFLHQYMAVLFLKYIFFYQQWNSTLSIVGNDVQFTSKPRLLLIKSKEFHEGPFHSKLLLLGILIFFYSSKEPGLLWIPQQRWLFDAQCALRESSLYGGVRDSDGAVILPILPPSS